MNNPRFLITLRLLLSLLILSLPLIGDSEAHSSYIPDSTESEHKCICPFFEDMDAEIVVCRFEESCLPMVERVREWDVDINPKPVWGDFIISVQGGDNPDMLEVRVIDQDGFVKISAGRMGGRFLRLTSENLAQGHYFVDFLLEGQIVIRQRMIVFRPY